MEYVTIVVGHFDDRETGVRRYAVLLKHGEYLGRPMIDYF